MFHIVLFQPEIPPNTGNIVRLAANSGCRLHLIEPLGFNLDDRHLRRAGMDYAEFAEVVRHQDWAACMAALAGRRIFAFSTKGGKRHDQPCYADEDVFLFGRESQGLPAEILESVAPAQRIRLPMIPGCRSMNLSNAVAVTVYEAWRQLGFPGGL